jgi:hypothetical protein
MGSLAACDGDEETPQASAGVARLDEALATARADAEALEQAMASPPEPTSACDVDFGDVAGPNVWRKGEERRFARSSRFESEAEELRGELPELSEAGARRWLERISDLPRYELVVLPQILERPTILLQARVYEPGVLDGTAQLWDHEEDRWVCATEGVHAESSPNLELGYEAPPIGGPEDPEALVHRLQRRLDEDLDRNILAAAFEALRGAPSAVGGEAAEPAAASGPEAEN